MDDESRECKWGQCLRMQVGRGHILAKTVQGSGECDVGRVAL